MRHSIKIEQKYLVRILTGEKLFEVRLNDRDYQVGDTLHFLPLENKDGVNAYDIRSPLPEYKITYIHNFLGMADGYVVLGIKEAKC